MVNYCSFDCFLGLVFLIKQSDYIISFKAKTATGTISQGIQEWASNQNKAGKESATVLEKKDMNICNWSCREES